MKLVAIFSLSIWVVTVATAAHGANDVGLKYLFHQLANPMTKNAGERGIALAIDEGANFYMTGTLQQSGRFGDTILQCIGDCDLFVAKYDRNRKLIWLHHAKNASGGTIALHGMDSIVVGGTIRGRTQVADQDFPNIEKPNGFIARYYRDGKAAWARLLSSTGACEVHGVAAELNQHIFVTGTFSALTDFGGSSLSPRGQRDGFLAKYNADGRLVWVRQHGDDMVKPGNVAIDKQGNAFVVGTVWDSSFGSQKVFLINSTVGFKTGVYLIKYAPDGTVIWSKNANSDVEPTHRRSPEGLTGQNVVCDREGNPHISGVFNGTHVYETLKITNENKTSLFFAKYSREGALEWVRQRRKGDGNFGDAVTLASATTLQSAKSANIFDTKVLSSQAVAAAAGVRGTELIFGQNNTPGPAVSLLRIFKAGANVVLVWPAKANELVLESTDALMPFALWTVVPDPRTTEGAFVTMILPAHDAAKFYRLRAP